MSANILKTIDKAVKELNTTNSNLEKQTIMAKYENIKHIIRYVYDPLYVYHVTSNSINKYKKADIVDSTVSLIELLDNLRNSVWTGHTAIREVLGFIKTYGHRELILKIINKDLKIRMGIKHINSVFPGLIKEFNVAFAESLDKKMKQFNENDGVDWYVMQKLDGVRCIVMIEPTSIKFYSRTGILITTLGNVATKLFTISSTMKPTIIDCEICIMKDGEESFTGIMKEIKKKNHTIDHPVLKVFDTFSKTDFENGSNDVPYSVRHANAQKIVDMCKTPMIQIVPIYKCTPKKHAEMRCRVNDENWEGLILRKDVGYEGKRTNNLLKEKTFHREEFTVVDVSMGTIPNTGLDEEQIGLKNVTIMYKDNHVDVGSGFSIQERLHYYENPDDILQKVISVQYFEETSRMVKGVKCYSLRFPTFKGVHGVERDH
jgi:DNA ligase-1